MSGRDWMPSTRAGRLAMAKRWAAELPLADKIWKVSKEEIDELKDLIRHLETTQEHIDKGANDSYSMELLRKADVDLERYLRLLHRTKMFSPPMESEDYIRLDLPVPDHIRTPHNKVNEFVEFVIEPVGPGVFRLVFKVLGADNRAKPTGYAGAFLGWKLVDSDEDAPKNAEELTQHDLAASSPHEMRFREDERGKRMYITMCWQNGKGIKGAWSPIQWMAIP